MLNGSSSLAEIEQYDFSGWRGKEERPDVFWVFSLMLSFLSFLNFLLCIGVQPVRASQVAQW